MKPFEAVLAIAATGSALACAGGSAASGAARPQLPDTLRLEVGSPLVDGNYYPAHVGHNTVTQVLSGRPDTSASWINTLTVGDSAGRRVHRWHTGGQSRTQAGVTYRLDLRQNFDAQTQELLHYHSTNSLGGETQFTVTNGRVRGTQRLPNGTVNQLDFTLSRRGFPAGAADLIPPAVAGGMREGLVIIMPVWSVPSQNVVEQTWKVVRRTTYEMQGRTIPAFELDIFNAAGTQVGKIWMANESPYMLRWDIINPQGVVATRMYGVDATR